MNQLVTEQGVPTHRLIVKLDDGTFKTFFLTEKEADWMANHINSSDQFIKLPRSVDPNAPSFYPKRGAWMEKMTREEIQSRAESYARSKAVTDVKNEEEEKKKREMSEKVKKWITENPGGWEKKLDEAAKELSGKKGIFHSASKETKKNLVKFHAMYLVSEMI